MIVLTKIAVGNGVSVDTPGPVEVVLMSPLDSHTPHTHVPNDCCCFSKRTVQAVHADV